MGWNPEGIWRHEAHPLSARGERPHLAGILYLWAQAGGVTFDLFELQRIGFSPLVQKIAFVMLYVGFGILAAVWPFHTWSPVGHVAAPTAVSMIHAGVLMKLELMEY
jgi:NADH-quinone oxidoreductase subunit M